MNGFGRYTQRMDLRQWRLFVAVAEEGNFTRAAERVHLSQPGLSHQMRALEEGLGVSLFLRTARGVTLTPAGEVALDEARRLLDAAEQTVRRVRRAGGLEDQALRVAFEFPEFGSVPPLPSLLSTYRARFPEASVDLQELTYDQLEQALLNERLDIAFAFGEGSGPKLGFHPLLQGQYQVLLPEQHPLNQGAEGAAVRLGSDRLLLPRFSAVGQALLTAISPTGRAPKVVYRGTGVAAFAGLVAAGEGVALLPAPLVETALRSGLQTRSLEDGPIWSFGLLWRKDRPPPITEWGVRLIRQLVPRPVAYVQPPRRVS